MDEHENVFLQNAKQGTALPPRTSRYAIASAAFGAGTIIAMISSAALFGLGQQAAAQYVAYLQLLFPFAIVFGHLALRRIKSAKTRETGRGLALVGLNLGYFNLIIAAMILFFIFARFT